MRTCSIEGCEKFTGHRKDYCEKHYYRMRRNGNYYALKKHKARNIEFEINENGCFEVTSHVVQNNGYFYIKINDKRQSMHRHIYEQCFGKIPKGLVVRHKCDNKLCINPEHLELGTALDNVKDALERNRYKIGSKHPNSKLTESEVVEMKRLMRSGIQNKDLAVMFNVDRDTVSNIKTNRTWKHVVI